MDETIPNDNHGNLLIYDSFLSDTPNIDNLDFDLIDEVYRIRNNQLFNINRTIPTRRSNLEYINSFIMDEIPNINNSINFTSFNRSDISSNYNKEKYGRLTLKTFQKLYEKNFIKSCTLNSSVYIKIIDTYINQLEKDEKSISNMYKNTISFMNCLPTPKEIKKFLHNVKNYSDKKIYKDLFFIKLVYDVTNEYFKKMDTILLKVT